MVAFKLFYGVKQLVSILILKQHMTNILTYNDISTIPVSVEPFYGISRIDLCLF